jgi:FtsP/CotA-like multicopper oxidase with cupredoxin domain
MPTRRELIKMGVLGAGGFVLLPSGGGFGRVSSSFADARQSPRLQPFVDPLPTLKPLTRVGRFSSINAYARPFVGAATRFYEIATEERFVQFHRDLPATPVWAYVDPNGSLPPGPPRLITVRLPTVKHGQPAGAGILVRHRNNLTTAPRDFGFPTLTSHLHGGHQPAPADGFPTDIDNRPAGYPARVTIPPGGFYDYMYPFRDDGFRSPPISFTERESYLWFHDHILDFTGPNVYRGLATIMPVFDEIDTGNETDTSPGALRLPSGRFDLPLVLQDKTFDVGGALVFDPFDQDGFLGDTMVVNGVVQPFHEVLRRKYRLRFLNGSNARIYKIFLTNDAGQAFPMTQIATDGGLLARTIPNVASFTISPAERVEVVVDFGEPIFSGESRVYVENRLAQTNGAKPHRVVARGDRLMRLVLTGGRVTDDPSRLPARLQPFEPVPASELARAEHRSFLFDRRHGVFTINGEPVDLERPAFSVRRNRPQIWHLKNRSGGWWHPIHVHSALMRVLRRNGAAPPRAEADGNARKDTVLLRGNEHVDVFLNFKDYAGPFHFHCHNIEHEDMAMMMRFDVL